MRYFIKKIENHNKFNDISIIIKNKINYLHGLFLLNEKVFNLYNFI